MFLQPPLYFSLVGHSNFPQANIIVHCRAHMFSGKLFRMVFVRLVSCLPSLNLQTQAVSAEHKLLQVLEAEQQAVYSTFVSDAQEPRKNL